MMSACEFFDFGAEPPWLVDSCDGEEVILTSQSEFFADVNGASSSFVLTETSLEMDASEDSEGGPMDFDTQMDVDDSPGSGPTQNFAAVDSQAGRGFQFVDHHFDPVVVSLSIDSPLRQPFAMLAESSLRPPFAMLSAQHNPLQESSSSATPISAAGNRFARPAPATDLFLRAFKRQKFAHYL